MNTAAPDRTQEYPTWSCAEWDLPDGAVLVRCQGSVPAGSELRLRIEDTEQLLTPQQFAAYLALLANQRDFLLEKELWEQDKDAIEEAHGALCRLFGADTPESLLEAAIASDRQRHLLRVLLRRVEVTLAQGKSFWWWKFYNKEDLEPLETEVGKVLAGTSSLVPEVSRPLPT